jgi:uncharacterized membrane-anchored protein YhcB (DUF1043 family)
MTGTAVGREPRLARPSLACLFLEDCESYIRAVEQVDFMVCLFAARKDRFVGRLRTIGVALVVGLLVGWQNGAAQQNPASSREQVELQKLERELDKLNLEIAKLKNDWGPWPVALLGLVGGIVGAFVTYWVARRTRAAALDQATHEKRLDTYPQLIKATAPLAVYFPASSQAATTLDPAHCRAIGSEMSKWYFETGGLLLSAEARDAYFRLARALTRASLAKTLAVPRFPRDAEFVSNDSLNNYRKEIGEKNLDDVENWRFGDLPPETQGAARKSQEFQDYIFLQRLSSQLRTRLTEDLGSRLRPSTSP